MKYLIISSLFIMFFGCNSPAKTDVKTSQTAVDNKPIIKNDNPKDYSKKFVLARACNPDLAQRFAQVVPSHIGNAKYIAATNDDDFIKKLETEQWSVVYMAPGACRQIVAAQPLSGSNARTDGWTFVDYQKLIYELQGDDIQIVESINEAGAIQLLNDALANARDVVN